MTTNRHESFEELISASLTDELTTAERQRLDAHLDSCSQCRATLAAFADQRRIMTGLRHVAPPRDLGARVRTGIERGRFASLPWWRRPAVIFAGVGGGLAAVTGALLAIVMLNGSPAEPNVGFEPTPTPIVEPTPTVAATLPPIPTPTPNASPLESSSPPPSPSLAPSPTGNPVAPDPEPDIVMAVPAPPTEVPPPDGVALSVREGATGPDIPVEAAGIEGGTEPEAPSGPPIAAELSPDGQWLAYITEIGQRGVNDVWATRLTAAPEPTDPEAEPPIDSELAVGTTVHLGESVAGGPFLELLAWSPDGRYLAYTLADPDTDETDADAWTFETGAGQTRRLTDAGNTFAASWAPSADGTPLLWISTAGDEPISHLVSIAAEAADPAELIDPVADAIAEAPGIFQPLLSPDRSLAIFWRGRMAAAPDTGWAFVEDGIPYLAEHAIDGDADAFRSERPVFSDLPSDGALFGSAAIGWGLDGDAYAIWHASWVGAEVEYPDPSRIYFGHATDARGLTRQHALDEGDVDEELVIVDVEVAPTGEHLVITARQRPGGVLDTPRAELLLVKRNTGPVEDGVDTLGVADGGWIGPAVFQPEPEADWDSSLAP